MIYLKLDIKKFLGSLDSETMRKEVKLLIEKLSVMSVSELLAYLDGFSGDSERLLYETIEFLSENLYDEMAEAHHMENFKLKVTDVIKVSNAHSFEGVF